MKGHLLENAFLLSLLPEGRSQSEARTQKIVSMMV